MRLLSRNAEALFWLARYLERGASLARVIEMQSSFGSHSSGGGWAWLLALHADDERFRAKHEPTPANIVAYYVIDKSNPGAIRSSIHWARENARALRPFIPLEMWVQLNAFNAELEQMSEKDIEPAELPRTCVRIRTGCLAQIGIADGTLFRDEGYLFFRLGLLLERADQTSRLLDVKFAQAQASGAAPNTGDDFVFWSTILRTAAAYQVFQRVETAIPDRQRVARFLAFNPSHPRAIGFCIREIAAALQMLRGTYRLSAANPSMEHCEFIMEGLQNAASDPGFERELHTFNDGVQRSLIRLADLIAQAFFPPPPKAWAEATTDATPQPSSVSQRQDGSQSQSQT